MGCFDTLRFHTPLPLPPELPADLAAQLQAGTFQTKDLGKAMCYYEVLPDGGLMRRTTGDETGLDWVRDDHLGYVQFYTNLGEHYTGWIEFRAAFVYGRLDRLELTQYRPIDPAEEEARAKRREKWLYRAFGSQEENLK